MSKIGTKTTIKIPLVCPHCGQEIPVDTTEEDLEYNLERSVEVASQKMKVINIKEDVLRFDNGLYIRSHHCQDCCEMNYLDFEQFNLGDEFPIAKTLGELIDQMRIKKDGFSLVDAQGIPKWAQARSCQNGYYSNSVGLTIGDGKIEWKLQDPKSEYDEYFEGREKEC